MVLTTIFVFRIMLKREWPGSFGRREILWRGETLQKATVSPFYVIAKALLSVNQIQTNFRYKYPV